MIAPLVVLAVICAAIGWRGGSLIEPCRRSWAKVLAFSLVLLVMALSILEGNLIAATRGTLFFSLVATIMALIGYIAGGVMRALFRRHT